jgi:hypothetical protein
MKLVSKCNGFSGTSISNTPRKEIFTGIKMEVTRKILEACITSVVFQIQNNVLKRTLQIPEPTSNYAITIETCTLAIKARTELS